MNKAKLLFLLCFWIWCSPMASVQAASGTVKISVEYAAWEQTPIAAVWLAISPEYHAYAHVPGNAGKPTKLIIAAPDVKNSFLRVWYPRGKETRDIFDPSEKVYIYEGNEPLFVDLTNIPPGTVLQARLELLLCSDKHCLPVERDIALTVPTTPLPDVSMLPWNSRWLAVRDGAPEAAPCLQKRETVSFPAVSPAPSAEAGVGEKIPAAWHFSPRYVQEKLEVSGLGKAILLGILAGLLLNVMPCVLPVLTLKISALLVLGREEDKAARLRRFRTHNLFFAAGILTLFTLLALIFSTAGFIWGQLFQSPAVVLGMLIVVFLLGLSMLGLFTLPVIDLKADVGRSPGVQAYVTGMVATLLATPCSGPLLGGVLGWAFTQSLPVLAVVFLAVGGGMSLPYVVFALRPSLATFLPRPGAWMGILERLVGFFLMGTALYLLSLLPPSQYMPTLTALLVVAFGGWIWGRFCGYDASPQRRRLLGGIVVILIAGTIFLVTRPPAQGVLWEPFSVTTFREVLGKEPLLLEFTADWCPNCKALERTTLTDANLRRRQTAYGLRLMRVDLTRPNPEAQRLLQALGSSSIPLTAIFPRGLTSSAPVVLRDIYSPATMDEALRRAFPAGRRVQPDISLFSRQDR